MVKLSNSSGASGASDACGPKSLTDSELYTLCKKYGLNARLWLRKFAGLLPEVQKRELYKKRGYASPYEFAAKLAGMSHKTVDRILRLAERLVDKPNLLSQLTSGSQGWSKLQTVSFIATKETDEAWAKKVKTMNTHAIEAYVQQIRNRSVHVDAQENNNVVMQAPWNSITFHVNPEMEQKLRNFKQQLEKEKKSALGWNEVIKEMFQRLESVSRHKAVKKTVVQLCPDCVQKRAAEAEAEEEVTRHIPAEVKRFVTARAQNHCEFSDCNKPIAIYHHTKRFALQKSHDPNFIAGLCTPHERLVHAGLIENEEAPVKYWKILDKPREDDPKFFVDKKVTGFRLEPAN